MPWIKEIDGIPVPRDFYESRFYQMKNVIIRPGDIALCSYLKCGTNWLAYIMWGIMHPNEEPPDGNRIGQDIPVVEAHGWGKWTNSRNNQPRIWSTHFPANKLPNDPRAKFIVLTRNPMDCCVSFYHFGQKMGYIDIPLEDNKVPAAFFEDFFNGNVVYGDFFKYVKGWYGRQHQSNIKFVTYEALSFDLKGEILKLARFLGRSDQLEKDNCRLLNKITQQSSFSFMKRNVKYLRENGNGKLTDVFIFRKGQVGSFKEELSKEHIKRLKQKMNVELEGTHFLELWQKL